MDDQIHPGEEAMLDLLFGLLSKEDRRTVLAHLQECPECERKALRRLASRERMRCRWRVVRTADGGIELEDALSPESFEEAGWAGLGRSLRVWSRSLLRSPAFRWAGAATLVTLTVIILAPHTVRSRAPLPLFLLPSTGEEVAGRAPEGGQEDRLKEAGEAYARGEFKRAAGLLEGFTASGAGEARRKLYLGSAQIWAGNHTQGVRVLRSLNPQTLPDRWRREAQWTLAAGLEHLGQWEEADSILRVLSQEPGEIGDRARRTIARHSGRPFPASGRRE